MQKALRLLGAGLLAAVIIRLADWLVTPVVPLLVVLFVLGLVIYVAVIGRRGGGL